jgi:hypothetical protein
MDAKITKKRLNDLLSYDWIKIIALVIAGIVLWSLIFTMTSVRLSAGQQFKFFLYYDVTTGDNFSDFVQDLKKKDILSFDVLDNSYEQLMEDTSSTILSARFAVNEGDIMFITNSETEADEENDIAAVSSNFKSFVDSYNLAYPIEDLIADAEAYYTKFYNEQGEFNMIFLKSHFKERMKGDNRYKTDEQFEKAYIQEMARIDILKNAVIKLKAYILSNPSICVNYKIYEQYTKNNPDDTDYIVGEEKIYGLDLSGIIDTDIIKNSAGGNENVTLVVLNWKSKQPDLQYEVIPVIASILP